MMLPKGNFKVLTDGAELGIVNVFYSDYKYSGNRNYFELFILPNGNLFISESLLTEILKIAGVEGLSFVLLQHLGHLYKSHTLKNLNELYKYGDLKK